MFINEPRVEFVAIEDNLVITTSGGGGASQDVCAPGSTEDPFNCSQYDGPIPCYGAGYTEESNPKRSYNSGSKSKRETPSNPVNFDQRFF